MRVLWSLLWLLTLALPAAAETIRLGEALRLAGTEHPLVRAAAARLAAAQAGAGEAGSAWWPRLGVAENFTVTDEPGNAMFIWLNQQRLELSPDAAAYNHPPTRHDFETRLWLRQPLYDRELGIGRERAQKGVEAAAAQLQWGREQLALAALQAYLQVQQARGALAAAQSARQEAGELLRLAREHRGAGTGLKSDELQAQVAVAEAGRQQLQAETGLSLARRALALAVGRAGGELDIAAPVTAAELPPLPPPFADRSDLQALQAAAEEAALAAEQGRAAWWPKAQLSAAYSLHDRQPFGAEGDGFTVQAGLSWEFFDGGARDYRRAGALARQAELRQQQDQARRQAAFALEEARLRAELARQQQLLAHTSQLQAEESHRLLLQRYREGLAPLADLLRTQTLLARTRQAVVESEAALVLALGVALYQNGNLLQLLAEEG